MAQVRCDAATAPREDNQQDDTPHTDSTSAQGSRSPPAGRGDLRADETPKNWSSLASDLLPAKALDAEPGPVQKSANSTDMTPPFRFAGFVGTVVSACMFSLGVLCVKLMPLEDTLEEKTKIVMIRGLTLMVLAGATILIQNSTFVVRREEIAITFIRSIAGFFGHFGLYVAIQYITIAEASALAYSSPLWTCILGHFLLRERLPITLVAAIPLGALALVLIAHPDFIPDDQIDELVALVEFNSTAESGASSSSSLADEPSDVDDASENILLAHRWPGVVLAILTSFVLAVINICLKLRKSTPIPATTFWLGVATSTMGAVIQYFIGFGSWPASWLEWALHLAIGVFSFLGQALLQWSLQYESAGTLSVVRTSDIVFSFIWSAVFLHEQVLLTSVLGAVLVALVVALIMFNDSIQRRLCSSCCQRKG